jgi:hypothetical protein
MTTGPHVHVLKSEIGVVRCDVLHTPSHRECRNIESLVSSEISEILSQGAGHAAAPAADIQERVNWTETSQSAEVVHLFPAALSIQPRIMKRAHAAPGLQWGDRWWHTEYLRLA